MIYYSYSEGKSTIKVTGHADFAKKGKDIVCASVSTAIIVSANLIERLGQIKNVEVKLEEGNFSLMILHKTKELDAISENLLWTLKQLEKQYPKSIKNQKE